MRELGQAIEETFKVSGFKSDKALYFANDVIVGIKAIPNIGDYMEDPLFTVDLSPYGDKFKLKGRNALKSVDFTPSELIGLCEDVCEINYAEHRILLRLNDGNKTTDGKQSGSEIAPLLPPKIKETPVEETPVE